MMKSSRSAAWHRPADLPRGFAVDWYDNDPFRTALANAVSHLIPAGEAAQCRTVRDLAYPDRHAGMHARLRIGGWMGLPADLLDDLRALAAQEAQHAAAHRQFNRQLELQGTLFWRAMHWERWTRRLEERDLRTQLGIACGFEHLAASIAENVIGGRRWLERVEPDVRSFWELHCLEELSHPEVSLRAYRAVGGEYWRRVLCYGEVLFVFGREVLLQVLTTLRNRNLMQQRSTWRAALTGLFGRAGFFWYLAWPLVRYLGPVPCGRPHRRSRMAAAWIADHGHPDAVAAPPEVR